MTAFRCVIDASVCIKHFIPDPLSLKVDQLLTHATNPQNQFFVPDLFYIESTNILWKYIRSGLYPAVNVTADLATLKSLQLQVVSTSDLMADAVNLALRYNISAYDACYVALSQQVEAILLTLDAKLVRALNNSGENICLFSDFEVPPYS